MKPGYSRTSRLTWSAAVCAVTVLLGTTLPAHAQSTGTQLTQARKKLSRIKSEYERIGEDFARTEALRGQTAIAMSRTQSKIERTQQSMVNLRGRLKRSVRAAYMLGGAGPFDCRFEARSFREFTLRLVVSQQQSLADQETILQLRRKRAELEAHQRELRAERRRLAGQSADLKSQGSRLSISLGQANGLVRELQGRLKLEEIERLFRITSVRSSRGSTMIVPLAACPVAGPHFVTNSFGDPRGGGTRTHEGNDIMAPKGAPVVAVASGSVSRQTGGLGGNAYFLHGNGASFYYAHLNDFVAADGEHVSAGQVIGHNGNTGDAAGGPDHVHFEIHPGGGAAIDPYPSLSAVC